MVLGSLRSFRPLVAGVTFLLLASAEIEVRREYQNGHDGHYPFPIIPKVEIKGIDEPREEHPDYQAGCSEEILRVAPVM